MQVEQDIEKLLGYKFWKDDNKDCFQASYNQLIERGWLQQEAVDFLYALRYSMSDEYGD